MKIEEYLQELRVALRVGPLRKRRIMREVEEHLRESARAVGEKGAIDRFGPVCEVAARFADTSSDFLLRAALIGFTGVAAVAATVGALSFLASGEPKPPATSIKSGPVTFRATVSQPEGGHEHFKPGALQKETVLRCAGGAGARLPPAGHRVDGFVTASSPGAIPKGSTHIFVATHRDGSVTARCD